MLTIGCVRGAAVVVATTGIEEGTEGTVPASTGKEADAIAPGCATGAMLLLTIRIIRTTKIIPSGIKDNAASVVGSDVEKKERSVSI